MQKRKIKHGPSKKVLGIENKKRTRDKLLYNDERSELNEKYLKSEKTNKLLKRLLSRNAWINYIIQHRQIEFLLFLRLKKKLSINYFTKKL